MKISSRPAGTVHAGHRLLVALDELSNQRRSHSGMRAAATATTNSIPPVPPRSRNRDIGRSAALLSLCALTALATFGPLAREAQAEVKVTDLGSWGGRINDIAIKDNVIAFHSGGRVVIADISNPAAPVELSSIDFRNLTSTLVFRDNILYVGGERNSVCFRTYDVSNPAAPVELFKSCGEFGGSPRNIAFWNDIAYTLHGTDVHSYDISNPANPIYHQGVYFSLGGPMAVAGDFLYMLSDQAKLLVFDLANAPNPYRPPLVTEFQLPAGVESGSIVINGTYAYLQPKPGDVVVVDIANPLAPSVVGTLPNTIGTGIEDANNLGISNGILYVIAKGTDATASTVKLFDLSNPASPTLISTFATADERAFGVRVSGSTAFVMDEGDGVVMVDCSDPVNPVRAGNIHSPEWMRDAAIDGGLLYVSDEWFGLTILEVAAPAHIPMNPVGVHESGGEKNAGIAVRNGVAYLCAGTAGLQTIDVADPSGPVLLYSSPIPPEVRVFCGIAVADGIAYVGAARDIGVCSSYLLTFDVSNPSDIILLDTIQIGSRCDVTDVTLVATGEQVTVHAVNQGASPAIIDASDPSNLALLSGAGPSQSQGLALSPTGTERFVITQNQPLGVVAEDVSNPTNPIQLGFSDWGGGRAIAVSGERAFTSRGVMDVSNPAAPEMVKPWQDYHFDSETDVLVSGPLVYGVAGYGSGGVNINFVYVPGDFDDDWQVGPSDIGGFVNALLHPSPLGAYIADLNEDGRADGADIAWYLEAMLN